MATTGMFVAPSLFGNGGTFDASTVRRTGNLEPVAKGRITLEDEELVIRIGEDVADVNVTYLLKNHGGATRVMYGFPVDMAPQAFPSGREDLSFGIRDGGGEPLPVEQILRKDSPLKNGGGSIVDGPYEHPVRAWHLVPLDFVKGELKRLTVQYRVKNLSTITGTSKESIWAESSLTFTYALSPSQTWGNGHAGRLKITADLTALKKAEVPIGAISLPGYREENGVYRWQFEDFDLRGARDFTITYDSRARRRDEAVRERRLPRDAIASVQVSSTRKPSKTTSASYGARNLLDGNFATAWIEGSEGSGKGDWIEVRFKKGVRPKFVALANGYWKDARRFVENGWIRKIRVESTYADGTKRKDDVALTHPDIEAALNLPYAAMEMVDDYGDSLGSEIRSLRLTILEVEAGTISTDTAVSELVIAGRWQDGS